MNLTKTTHLDRGRTSFIYDNGLKNVRSKYWHEAMLPDSKDNMWYVWDKGFWEKLEARKNPISGQKIYLTEHPQTKYFIGEEEEVKKMAVHFGEVLNIKYLKTI